MQAAIASVVVIVLIWIFIRSLHHRHFDLPPRPGGSYSYDRGLSQDFLATAAADGGVWATVFAWLCIAALVLALGIAPVAPGRGSARAFHDRHVGIADGLEGMPRIDRA
jgi:hypothetical protein